MNQIAPLTAAKPAFMTQMPAPTTSANAAATANMPVGYAVMSIRNREWAIRHSGQTKRIEQMMTDGQGRQSVIPVRELEVVLVAVSPHISKTYYGTGFDPESHEPPDCRSIDGIRPDRNVKAKQSELCQNCQQNQIGSAQMREGGKPSKACPDRRRVAVVPATDTACEVYGGPILLNLPWRSMKNLATYSRYLTERLGADLTQVITVMSFASGANISHQEIEFRPVGYIEAQSDYEMVQEHASSDYVHRMLQESSELSQIEAPAPSLGNRPAFMQPAAQTQAQAAPPAVQEAAPKAPKKRTSGFGAEPPAQLPAQPQAQPQTQPQAQPEAHTNGAAHTDSAHTDSADEVHTEAPIGAPIPAPDDMSSMIENLLKLNS